MESEEALIEDWACSIYLGRDITREKMELMVEEDYNGSSKDILHYISLIEVSTLSKYLLRGQNGTRGN